MNSECCTEKQHNLAIIEEELEKAKTDIEVETSKVAYFESIIISANNLRKLTETKIIQTESRKLDLLSNKLDSQIQSISELVRKAEIKRDEAITKVIDAEVSLIVLENKILHSKLTNF